MTYTKEQLREKYNNLPEDIKNALGSVEILDLISTLSGKFNLHIDQRGDLASEIGLVLLGVTRPDNFLSSIQKRLNIPIATAGEIVKEVNQAVFFPIRASLEKMNNGGLSGYKTEPAPKVEHFSPAGNISEINLSKTKEPLPTPDNNAIIVGNTAPLDSDRSMFDQKMGKLFRLPKEELELGTKDSNDGPRQTKIASDPYKEGLD